MAGPFRNHSDVAVANSGIAQVLDWYATRGGNLLGSRRWEQSPLVLSNLRWLGPSGESREASRDPQDEARLSAVEREVWVELAVAFSNMHPMTNPNDPLWLPLGLSQQRAIELAERLRPPSMVSGGGVSTIGRPPAIFERRSDPPAWAKDRDLAFHDAPTQTSLPPLPPGIDNGFGKQHLDHFSVPPLTFGGHSGENGATVLACVEVELPMAALGPAGTTAKADFARDIAMNFSRAAHQLPQVHEVRGWMRSGRMVLAARMVVTSEPRSATRAETENALSVLRDALMARTIPYSKLMVADPGEWMQQGQVLQF